MIFLNNPWEFCTRSTRHNSSSRICQRQRFPTSVRRISFTRDVSLCDQSKSQNLSTFLLVRTKQSGEINGARVYVYARFRTIDNRFSGSIQLLRNTEAAECEVDDGDGERGQSMLGARLSFVSTRFWTYITNTGLAATDDGLRQSLEDRWEVSRSFPWFVATASIEEGIRDRYPSIFNF